MKRITSLVVKSLVIILIGSATLAMNLQAQSDLATTARIPFPFTVDAQRIPAGTYQFRLVSSPFLLSVRNVKTGSEELFIVRPKNQPAVEPSGRLTFGNSEGSRALNEVHFPFTDTFIEVIQRHSAQKVEAMRPSTFKSMTVAQR